MDASTCSDPSTDCCVCNYCERQNSGHCPVRGMDPPTEYDCLSWFSRAGMCETHMYNDGTFCDLERIQHLQTMMVCVFVTIRTVTYVVFERENFNHIPQILRTSPTSLNYTLETYEILNSRFALEHRYSWTEGRR